VLVVLAGVISECCVENMAGDHPSRGTWCRQRCKRMCIKWCWLSTGNSASASAFERQDVSSFLLLHIG